MTVTINIFAIHIGKVELLTVTLTISEAERFAVLQIIMTDTINIINIFAIEIWKVLKLLKVSVKLLEMTQKYI